MRFGWLPFRSRVFMETAASSYYWNLLPVGSLATAACVLQAVWCATNAYVLGALASAPALN